ncbi:MAG TPA: TonB family protein [Thermoanaerobaculia bacterium]|nr:TonB family protein [Thermoanaerobaculia bacterium]
MTRYLALAASLLGNAVLPAGAGVAPQVPSDLQAPTSLCIALASVDRGQERTIVVSGVYRVGYEAAILYDPQQLRCDEDVQPLTWIEFAKDADTTVLDKILEKDDRAYVTFSGTLFGPPPLEPDTPKLPDKWSAGDRMRGTRYGHQNHYRTQLLVSRVVAAARVPAATPWSPPSSPADLAERELTFRSADFPIYPYSARLAGIEGEVEVEVTVKEGKVVATRVLAGDRALAVAAVANIETWTFSPDVNKTFVTRFVYTLERRFGPLKQQRIEVEMPTLVRITAPRNGW